MPLTLATADAALKELYLPRLRMQLNDEASPTMVQLERSSEQVEGRRAVLSLHVSRNVGTGSRAEGGALPAAGQQGYVEERIPLKYHYGRIQLNGPVIRHMKSDKGSFVRAVSSEVERIVVDLKEDMGRQIFNDATQSIAVCGVTSAANVVVLAAATTPTQMRQFIVGMAVDIGTVAAPTTIAGARTITAVNRTAKTITISGAAVTTSALHFVFKAGNAGNELTGIRQIVDNTGTLFNINSSTYDIWQSYVNANGGTARALTDTILQTALDEVQIASGKSVDLAVTSFGIVRNYSATLTSLKQFVNTLEMKGGHTGVSVSSGSQTIGLMPDRFAPEGQVQLLNTSCLTFHEMSDWEFMQEDGSVLTRVSGFDAYEATLFTYRELATDSRVAHGVIRDITN